MLKSEEEAIASIAPSSERTPSFLAALRKKAAQMTDAIRMQEVS